MVAGIELDALQSEDCHSQQATWLDFNLGLCQMLVEQGSIDSGDLSFVVGHPTLLAKGLQACFNFLLGLPRMLQSGDYVST